jgi:hypothetical protein
VSVYNVQRICLEVLKLPSHKMANKPLLNKRMEEDRFQFARQYAHLEGKGMEASHAQ